MRLDFHGASVRAARERLRDDLAARCTDSRLEDARVVVSELVANSLRHATPLDDEKIAVGWTFEPDIVRVTVTDGGSPMSVPSQRRTGELAVGGRGLKIVQSLAKRWGVQAEERGTTVWAELSLA